MEVRLGGTPRPTLGTSVLPDSTLDDPRCLPAKCGVLRLIVPITKGIIREQTTRRSAIFFVMLTALVMLFLGATFLDGWLREHPALFILYWLACAWATMTGLLLALYDMLMLRVAARREQRRLAAEHLKTTKSTDENPR